MKPTGLLDSVLHGLVAMAVFGTYPAWAFELNDQLSVAGILAPAGQCQDVSARLPSGGYGTPWLEDDESSNGGVAMADPARGAGDSMDAFGNECRGGLPLQLEVSFHPDDNNEFFFKFGFAAGNGLNEVSPWALAPWAADLEEVVKDINGRGRSYLLTAWYEHRVVFQNETAMSTTVGIIDSTDYIDGNAYANDEYSQFMNESFVNSATYDLPSYDVGAASELGYRQWTLTGLGMNIGENEDGNNYNFWGAEIGYHPETPMGAGNYRLTVGGTSVAFLDPSGEDKEGRLGFGLSFDQEFGPILGAFLRCGWQNEAAAVDYRSLYSGGFDFSGKGWNRDEDNVGIGYAYLDGGNEDIEYSRVFEAYYRAELNDYAAVTADIQYMQDAVEEVDPSQDNPAGWIFGLRVTAEF